MIDIEVLNKLNVPTKERRLQNLAEVLKTTAFPPTVPEYVNNHIHTTYSFSPYSPTAAVYAARMEGLCTAGLIDHDTISGAGEFLEAAKLIDMPVTTGLECRVNFEGTRIAGRRINNPDQKGIAYMTIHSVPHDQFDQVTQFFLPFQAARHERNRKMVENINGLLSDVHLDYDKDVLPISCAADNGTVTERHLMYALGKKLVDEVGRGKPMIERLFFMGVNLSEKQKAQMLDTEYPFYEYDLLGILKSSFVQQIYVNAADECPMLHELVEFCRDIDAALCYAYLGDVKDSVTGDKKQQKFEDDYLEELFACLIEEDVEAVTYMPTRNSREQLL